MLRNYFKLTLFLFILFLGASFGTLAQKYTISGFVYEKGSRETMLAVNVYAAGTTIGTVTNSYGFYSLCLLYTSDAADDLPCVDLGGRRSIKKKKNI